MSSRVEATKDKSSLQVIHGFLLVNLRHSTSDTLPFAEASLRVTLIASGFLRSTCYAYFSQLDPRSQLNHQKQDNFHTTLPNVSPTPSLAFTQHRYRPSAAFIGVLSPPAYLQQRTMDQSDIDEVLERYLRTRRTFRMTVTNF